MGFKGRSTDHLPFLFLRQRALPLSFKPRASLHIGCQSFLLYDRHRYIRFASDPALALIGLVILFLLALMTQLTTVRHGVNWSQAGIAFLEALIRARAWGLVLAATFGWRK
jgi:hypothetical protein